MKKITLPILILFIIFIAITLKLKVYSDDDVTKDNNSEALAIADYPYPVGVLFANEDYSYFIEHVTDPGDADAFMVAGYNNSSTIDILKDGAALVTFVEHPQDWNGGGTLAQRPVQLDPYNVNYDLSNVNTISFEIKSSDFNVDQISFGVQWEGPNYNIDIPSQRRGGEKLFTLSQLGVEDIKNWTKVIIDVSLGGHISDFNTLRPEHTQVAFHKDKGNTFVKVPLMMIWAGRSHQAGEFFKIRNIAFHDALGEHIEIASDILKKATEHVERD